MLKSKIQKIQGSSVRRVLSTPPSLCVSEGGAQVSNRKYRIVDAIYVISNVFCFSFEVYFSLFQWDNNFLEEEKKERNKQNASSKFKIQFFLKFLALKFCSTSPPGGNQVDGLPPVVKFKAEISVSLRRPFFIFFEKNKRKENKKGK